MKAPTLIVCIKAIPDPEGPASSYEVDLEAKKVIPVGIPLVINPYDANALEIAIRLKDLWGGRVIAINVTEKGAVPVLRKALSVGADELILAEDAAFRNLTSRSTALILSAAVQKIGAYDLILTGRQAADWDFGQVGLFIAENLKIPVVNLAQKVELQNGSVVVEKLTHNGYEVVRASMPALVTVSSEVGDLRLPTIKSIQDVRKKPLQIWRLADIGINSSLLATKTVRALFRPPSIKRKCIFVEGNSFQEKGENLALTLLKDKVL
jgi:electron transfer flavoprotein beta subunit